VTFDNIPPGETVFLDANILVYAATAHPQYGAACQRLLEQVENNIVRGCTSAHVLAELAHRLMTIEAAQAAGRSLTGIANWLRRHPDEVRKLSQYRRSIDDLHAIPVTILPVSGLLVSRAADFSCQFGLLTNDALVVAVMQANGLAAIASLDADFDNVPGLNRYSPV
jgi:predicted nucleic acid-binding protein